MLNAIIVNRIRRMTQSWNTKVVTGRHRYKKKHVHGCLQRNVDWNERRGRTGMCLLMLFFLALVALTTASVVDFSTNNNVRTISSTYAPKSSYSDSYTYNAKDASHYLSLILQNNRSRTARSLQKDDNKNKDDVKDKVPSTPPPTRTPSVSPSGSPTPRPTRSPTALPSLGPTRAPVVVPWRNWIVGYIQLKVSIFSYEEENVQVVAQQTTDTFLGRRKLERLSAAEILNNKHNDLIEVVLSSVATILCGNSERIEILSVVNATFYNYCEMLGDPQALSRNDLFQVYPDALDQNQTFLVTDLMDEDTGLLNIEDRRVFVSSQSDGSDGDYLHWTVWSVSYPILQYGTVLDVSPIQTNRTRTTDDIQATVDRLFSTAVTNGAMDELLKEKSVDTLVASLEGWEVETFVRALKLLESNSPEDMPGDETTSPQGRAYVFWQPIRIAGFVILGTLVLTVGLLMKVGHERYKYEAWDTIAGNHNHNNNSKRQSDNATTHGDGGNVNVDISTCEGLDFMLHCSHQARKQSTLPNGILSLSQDQVLHHPFPMELGGARPMDMGNTLSEIAGPPVKSSIAGAAPDSATATPRPSPARVMRKSLLQGLGLANHQDYNHAECISHGGEYALVSVKTKANRSPSTQTYSLKPLLPHATKSDSGSKSSGEVLLLNSPTSSEMSNNGKKNAKESRIGDRKSSKPNMKSPSTPKANPREREEPATPENAERVRTRDGDYAFISVSSKSRKY